MTSGFGSAGILPFNPDKFQHTDLIVSMEKK
jgi:hypothetical protein